MAIDTAIDRRQAAAGAAIAIPSITPDSGKVAVWRQSSAGTYGPTSEGGGGGPTNTPFNGDGECQQQLLLP